MALPIKRYSGKLSMPNIRNIPWLSKSLPAYFSSLTGKSTVIEFSNPKYISYYVSVVYYCVFS